MHTTATTWRPPTAIDDGTCVVRGVEHHDLGVVADEPDVVVDFPTATVEFERAVGDDACDRAAVHFSTTTERSTSPACILWKASSMSPMPDALGDELLQRQPALQVEADQRGKSRSGRQSPYHDDFSAPPREKKSISGISERRMSGRRNADQHNGSGQIAGVERLLPGLRPADRVDHHVGAVAVGEVLDASVTGSSSRALMVCVAPNSRAQFELLVVGVDAR